MPYYWCPSHNLRFCVLMANSFKVKYSNCKCLGVIILCNSHAILHTSYRLLDNGFDLFWVCNQM